MPVNAPIRLHNPIVSRQASHIFAVCTQPLPPNWRMSVATMTEARAMMLPTERSIPPEIITIVMPMAIIAMMETCSTMFIRLPASRNVGQ